MQCNVIDVKMPENSICRLLSVIISQMISYCCLSAGVSVHLESIGGGREGRIGVYCFSLDCWNVGEWKYVVIRSEQDVGI